MIRSPKKQANSAVGNNEKKRHKVLSFFLFSMHLFFEFLTTIIIQRKNNYLGIYFVQVNHFVRLLKGENCSCAIPGWNPCRDLSTTAVVVASEMIYVKKIKKMWVKFTNLECLKKEKYFRKVSSQVSMHDIF